MEIKPVEKSINRFYVYALILLSITAFYLYADYYSWLPRQVFDNSDGSVNEGIVNSYTRNQLYVYLGEFGNLFFFTVQTFYFLVVMLALYGFKKSEKVKLWVNFGKIYALLVAGLYSFMILPTIPITQLPYTFAIETTMHLLVPGLYLWFTKDIGFVADVKDKYFFMIIPLSHYALNWVLQIASRFRAWSYPFFNFGNPLMQNWNVMVKVIFNLILFTILVSVFQIAWRLFEKKKAQ